METTDIANSLDTQIAAIYETTDIDELLGRIRQIDALKEALESCDRFRENAVKFAILEAAALIRVVRLGGQGKLRGFRRKTAEWLAGLSDQEAQAQIQKCAEGLTIDQIWRRDINTRNIYADLEQAKANALEWLQEDGYTSIRAYAEKARAGLPPEAAAAMVDGLRHALRRAGAVGIGDDGDYILPGHPGQIEFVIKAVSLRYVSIRRDLLRIQSIIRETGVTMSETDIDPDCHFKRHKDLSYVMQAIRSYGAFD